ncbi:MAG: AAA family ATPase, partial [Betaproteobacteria bacterium]
DVAKLITNLNGAKLICSGDTRQLQPVSGGAPVSAIMRLNSSSRISEIRRQSVDWQRAASMAMSSGNISEGLDAYDLRGNVTWGSTREETIAALVADVRTDLLGSPGKVHENLKHLPPRIVITTRNADIRDLNSALRPIYRECGIITGPDFVVNAIGRGSNQLEAPLHIAVGDRLVFGETIKLSDDMIASHPDGNSPQTQISNSDFGTILSITSSDDPTNPIVQIKMDKGVIIEAHWNNLTTKSDKQTKRNHAPKIQHAFSCTAHASQGSTVSRAFVFDGHGGMSSESALVSLTRHRTDAKIYIDTSPVREDLEARSADVAIKLSHRGKLDAPDQGDCLSGNQTSILLADIKKSIRAIYNRSSMKTNISTFANDINDWLAGEESLGSVMAISSESQITNPWYYQNEGLVSLTAAMRAEAELAHKKWQESNPDLHTLDIVEYVRPFSACTPTTFQNLSRQSAPEPPGIPIAACPRQSPSNPLVSRVICASE